MQSDSSRQTGQPQRRIWYLSCDQGREAVPMVKLRLQLFGLLVVVHGMGVAPGADGCQGERDSTELTVWADVVGIVIGWLAILVAALWG